MNKVPFKLGLVLGLAVILAFPLQIQATTIGNALIDRTYTTDNAANVFVMDFAVGQAATLQSVSTWSQVGPDFFGHSSAGFSFSAYVLQSLGGGSYQVAYSAGPHVVGVAGVVDTFSVSPFALQASDWIAHFGQGIPLDVSGGTGLTFYPAAAPVVGDIIHLPPTYSSDRTYSIAINANVPEPTSMLLLGFGLMGLAGIRRKLS